MVSKRSKIAVLAIGAMLLIFGSLTSVIAEEEAAVDRGEPIKNLQFQAAEIRSVLTFLADYGGVNVVVSPDVKGTVTIKLNDVEWRTALDIIGRTYDLAVVYEDAGYVRVLPNEDYRKETTENEQHRKQQQDLIGLETKVIKISNSASDDIVEAVKSLLTERGEAMSDTRSNSIIIREVPDNIASVEHFITELDKPAQQIKISAQLLEIFTTDIEELGISWDANGTYTTESGRSYPQSANLVDRVSDYAGQYRVMALQSDWSAEAVVKSIINSGKGKVIAHPEITTIDNKEAKIQMGQKVPVKQFDESGNVVIVFEEVGTILRVTPHITAENQILMHLIPERSTYSFDPNGVIINTSNAETNVIVENGQTAVIGGLTTQDEVEGVVGVPVLKDIPVLGIFFKYTNKRMETRDLVIFVTPSIIQNDLAMGG
ncbi:MAG: secretin N-terminal domain-containing protein [bacterium]|nr:secretin N-terminal domain-containing protein [bacterium]